MAAGSLDQVADAPSSELEQRGICDEAASAPRPFRVPVDLVARVRAGGDVRSADRHRGAMRDGISNERVAAIEWNVEPFVAVRCPRIRAFDSGDEMTIALARARPEPESAIDVN